MTSLSSDFTGCPVLIYDNDGERLGNTVITSYNRTSLRIEVKDTPQSLDAGCTCKLLILSSPSPCEFCGRVNKDGNKKIIAMYFGHEVENRGSTRYKVSFPGAIENLICDGKAYPLHTPLQVRLMNISQSGVRFRTPYYSLIDGDRFQMRIEINNSAKLLIADVVNHVDRDNDSSEYGCRFLIGSERVV